MTSTSHSLHEPSPALDIPINFPSPKRKRDHDDTQGRDGSPMRLRTELPSRPLIDVTEDLVNPASPRTKVSDQLNSLKLDINFSVPVLRFGKSGETRNSIGQYPVVATEDLASRYDGATNKVAPVKTAASASSPLIPLSTIDLAPPQTPTLRPITTLQSVPQVISPLPISSPHPGFETGSSPLASKPNQSAHPPRIKSPPPPNASAAHASMAWTAAEITGHDPTDPADDGYGINGIGFRPTPAIAQARAQKRRQQLAEWRSREAKEARQRRFERRKGLGKSSAGGLEKAGQTPRRVRFVEG
ncbi:MAG: hypothetical protein LQ340_004146 [Diploschistes diacapsis]|nr:MAG: hypothetical protein LQ340_004146 [Diploschistes diacapsis]